MGLISIRFSNKDDKEYEYCMKTLANVREGIINESSSWRVGLREVLVKLCKYWNNSNGDITLDDKGNDIVKPYYYTKEKLQELYDLVDIGKRSINIVKQTEIERTMPEILEFENENELIKTIAMIKDRHVLISLYDDYIKGDLTKKIMDYLKMGMVRRKK